jgi:hypothetical protein
MYDDLLPQEKELTLEEILVSTGIGKCRECQNFSNSGNDVCSVIRKAVHPDQIGCLDFYTSEEKEIK